MEKHRQRKILNPETQKLIHNPKKEKINILNVFKNGWDGEFVFVDILRANNFDKTQEDTLVLSKRNSEFLIKALCDALEERKFINKGRIKGGNKYGRRKKMFKKN